MSLENLSIEARDELAALAQQLAENPDTRKDFLRMTKKVKPDIPIPELEIEEVTTRAVGRAEQRVQELEAKLKQKEALEELKRRREAIVEKGLATKDDIEGIEKLMLEKKIADHETAAQYHEWMKQAAEPTPSGYNPSPMKKWDLSSYRKNPVTAARDEAVKALSELRKPTRPIGL
jgi:septal ring factor EnvC (AmiA/AmiB activator)